jgi:hypothetical protein
VRNSQVGQYRVLEGRILDEMIGFESSIEIKAQHTVREAMCDLVKYEEKVLGTG